MTSWSSPKSHARTIPVVDVAAIFDAHATADRDRFDAEFLAAASGPGFAVLEGLPEHVPAGSAARDDLARLFALPEASLRRLYRQSAAPENSNVYRGFFPLSDGIIKHGIDIGPPARSAAAMADGAALDALLEETPLPDESALPGWRSAVHARFAAFEDLGGRLMRALARGLGLAETHFDEAFRNGNSTLRLIEYPPWPEIAASRGLPLRAIEHSGDGPRRFSIGGEHVDSGFVTLLEQDQIGGLEARIATEDGDVWTEVAPREGTLAVNFGKLLERWTAGRVRATEHRVLGNDVVRRSIPFFYEPRVDAKIEPLPIPGVAPFEPFVYGDHLWEAMTKFSEFARARRFRDAR